MSSAIGEVRDNQISEHPKHPSKHYNGLEVFIENPSGSVRSGQSKTGKKWSTNMIFDYGCMPRVIGADGEHLDIYLGPINDAREVYIVHQVNPSTGVFDEDKVMLGFSTAASARLAYLAHYDNPAFFGSMTVMDFEMFLNAISMSNQNWFKWKNNTGPMVGVSSHVPTEEINNGTPSESAPSA